MVSAVHELSTQKAPDPVCLLGVVKVLQLCNSVKALCSINCCLWHCRALEFIEGVTSSANKAGVFASTTATAYWAYHLTRTGFLAVQGLSGAVAHF